MRNTRFLPVTLSVILLVSAVTSGAQKGDVELSELSDLIERAAREKMPGWKYTTGEPIVKTERVLIASFASDDKRVKVSVLTHHSRAEAEKEISRLKKRDKSLKKLDDFGEEGYSRGFANSKVAFRKGTLTVYISITADEINKEAVEINKQFAKLIAAALPN